MSKNIVTYHRYR